MNIELNKLMFEAIPNQEKANDVLNRLFSVAQPGAVYTEPVVSGDYTIITASEVTVAMGVGYGGGGGVEPQTGNGGPQASTGEGGFGGGGGGGGTATGRPVAAIIVGPKGVRVEPVVDATKIALAFFTMVGSMLLMLNKMRKAGQNQG